MAQSKTSKVLTLSSGQFLMTLAGIACAAVLTRVLSKVEYAAYRQTLLVYGFVSPLLVLGLPKALYYFLPQAVGRERAVLTGNLLLLLGMGGVFAAFILLGGNRLLATKFNNPALSRLLLIYSPYALLALPPMAINASLVVMDRVRTLATYNVLSKVLLVCLVIGGVLIWRTPEAAIIGLVLAALFVFLPAIYLMYGAMPKGSPGPSWTDIGAQVKYSIPLGMAGMIGTISLSLDKMIVSGMCTPEQFAVYVNGAMQVPLVGIVTVSVTAVLMPEFVRLYSSSEGDELRHLWHRAMLKCLALFLPVTGFILVMGPEIMRVLYSAQYEGSAYPFRVYALRLPVAATNFGAVLMAMGHTPIVTFGAIFSLTVNGILSVILVHFLGATGAAWATTASIVALAMLYSVIISRYLHVGLAWMLPWRGIVRLLVGVLPGVVILTWAMGTGPLATMSDVVRLLIAGTLFGPTVCLFYKKLGVFRTTGMLPAGVPWPAALVRRFWTHR